MSFYSEMLDRLIMAAEYTNPYAKIIYGSDPPEDGICMIPNGGMPNNTFLDRAQIMELPILLNGKNKDQRVLLDDLTAIHEVLTKCRSYTEFNTEAVQITSIESLSLPQIIGREQNNQWVCGSTLLVKFYFKSVDFFNINN